MDSYLLLTFGRILQWNHLGLEVVFFFWWGEILSQFYFLNSYGVIQTISFILDELWWFVFSRNWSISISVFVTRMCVSYWSNSLLSLWCLEGLCWHPLFHSWYQAFVFSLFFLCQFSRGWSILLIFSSNQLFVSLILSFFCFWCPLFHFLFYFLSSTPSVGLELATLRSTVTCSTNWASWVTPMSFYLYCFLLL